MARGDWVPLLSGTAAAQAREAVAAIVSSLEGLRDAATRHPSLADGGPGIALLYRYLALCDDDSSRTTQTEEIVRETLAAVDSDRLGPALYGGITGPAWAASHLLEKESADRVAGSVDEALIRGLDQHGWGGPFDLIGGLVGLGVYALERLRAHQARQLLKGVVDCLDELAEQVDVGIVWRTTRFPAPSDAERYPRGRHDLGMAHGAAGVISLLAAAHEANVARDRTGVMLEGAIKWLLEQRLPPGQGSLFPYWAAPGEQALPARMAWCYGDPGIAVALLLAARTTGRSDWEEAALTTARTAARRPPDETGIVDCGLCHGAGGVAHIFNRLFQLSGDDEFADAARFWLAWTLEQRRPGGGVGGFLSLETGRGRADGWRPVPGFLTGAAGVGLALLAATSRIEPGWDRVMLLSTRP
jgi:lantibiotic modifying enzyme